MPSLVRKCAVLTALIGIGFASSSWAAGDQLNAAEYELFPGDFNGDGMTDVLYIAKDPQRLSGILIYNDNGHWDSLQTWGNAYLGISWSPKSNSFVVADFNGDGRADVLVQRKAAGDHYLIFSEEGGLGGIAQAIPNFQSRADWSGATHRIVAGDFNGDGRADVFLQGVTAGDQSALVFTDSHGQFTLENPAQVWGSSYLGFHWPLEESNVLAGDFNGDGRDDLLIQAKPIAGTGPGTDLRPVYPSLGNGVAISMDREKPFRAEGVQAWGQVEFGVDWSPFASRLITGDFNSDGLSDVLMASVSSYDPGHLLFGRAKGPIFSAAEEIGAGVIPSKDDYVPLLAVLTKANRAGLLLIPTKAGSARYGVFKGGQFQSTDQILELPSGQSTGRFEPLAATSSATSTSFGGGAASAALITPTSAGRTTGTFGISSVGAATYEIPIWTPPGARGIQPALALSYVSGAGDGWVGRGWNISGLSTIYSCNRTFADNGHATAVSLTSFDDYCLDGKRLRLTSLPVLLPPGTATYETVLADFSRVTATVVSISGPSKFIVEGKDGLIYEYGNTTDSKAYAVGSPFPYAWYLNKIRDRQGNNLIVTYSTVNGVTKPISIQYTQTVTNGTTYPYTVEFAYTSRTAPTSKYIAGNQSQSTELLAAIRIKSGSTIVRRYYLSYDSSAVTQRDRLTSVQECTGAAGTDCLRPTTFTYQSGSSGISNPSISFTHTVYGTSASAGDFDGDGTSDLLFAVASGSNRNWYVKLGSTSVLGYTYFTGIVTTSSTPDPIVADAYGSGKDCLMALNGSTWTVWRWAGGGSFSSASTGLAIDSGSSNVLADTNGDGLPDLVTLRTNEKIYIRLNTSTSSVPSFGAANLAYDLGGGSGGKLYSTFSKSGVRALDFNGDGQQDIIAQRDGGISQRYYVLVADGVTLSNGLTLNTNEVPLAFGFFNEDACTDVLTDSAARLSGCIGGSSVGISVGSGTPVATVDWDGDGRTDVISNVSGTIKVYRSLSTSFATAVSTGFTSGTANYVPLDFNGDGLNDVVRYVTGSTSLAYGMHNGAYTAPDLVTSFTDGWGITANVTYQPITLSLYTKGTSATFPDVDVKAPIYVVSQAQQSDGQGGFYSTSMSYWGARFSLQGRGFLGFSQVQAQDSRTGLITRTQFRQDYPHIGSPSQQDVYLSDGTTLIGRTSNSYAATDLGGVGCSAGRCFPYVSGSTTSTYDLNSALPIQTASTAYVYDNFGNAIQVSETSTDNDAGSPYLGQSWTTITSNTITNNTTTWCLGKPSITTTQKNAPGQPSVTRRTDHDVDYTYCRFSSETLEPLSSLEKVTNTFGYDSCGNLTSTSVVGLDRFGSPMTARVTSSSFGVRCQLPESLTNALGQTVYRSYNYDFGLPSAETDLNGATTSHYYDNFGREYLTGYPDYTTVERVFSDCVAATCWGVSNLRLSVTEVAYASGSVFRSHASYFDGLSQKRYESAVLPNGATTWIQTTFDQSGRTIDETVPYTSASNGYHHYGSDVLGRPLSDKLYDGSGLLNRESTTSYVGLKTISTDGKGNATSRQKDVTGKLRRITDPSSPAGETNYTYDSFGNLVRIEDPSGALTNYTYNTRGFKTSSDDPDSGYWTFQPNSLNELVRQVDAKSQVSEFGYDLMGRMTSRLEPEDAYPTTWTFGTSPSLHNVGQVEAVEKPGEYREDYWYDWLGRGSQARFTMDGVPYEYNLTYNSIGAVDVVTYPEVITGDRLAVKNNYTNGYLTELRDDTTGSLLWSLQGVNDSGLASSEVLGNGATVTSGYVPWTNDLSSVQIGTGGSSNNLQNLNYAWDLAGNLDSRQDAIQGLTEVFSHDSLNRLTGSTLNGVPNLAVSYSASGNIVSKDDVGAYDYTSPQSSCTTYYAHAQPHAVRNAGGAQYCYDANGNMTSRQGSAITWFSYNQPNQINNGANWTKYFYNADHQRWKQVANYGGVQETTRYVGGLLEIVERSGVTEYRHQIPAGTNLVIHKKQSGVANAVYYATTDHLGSADLVMDSSGSVLVKESFTAFGARRGSNWQGIPTTADYTVFRDVTRRGFTGHEMLDAVGLVNMNGRVYDPYLARVLSPDPLIPSMALSQAVNPFSYVMNSPLSWTDPSGYSFLGKGLHWVGHKVGSFGRSLLNTALHDLNLIVGGALMLAGALTVNPALSAAGFALVSSPVHVTLQNGKFGVAVRIGFAVIAPPSANSARGPPNWGNGSPEDLSGIPVMSENGIVDPNKPSAGEGLRAFVVGGYAAFSDDLASLLTFGYAPRGEQTGGYGDTFLGAQYEDGGRLGHAIFDAAAIASAFQGLYASATRGFNYLTARVALRDAPRGAAQLGRAGEAAAGIVKNTERIASATGTAAYRVPDALNHAARTIGEVKNVGSLSYTNQLRDFASYASRKGYTFELWVRPTTQLSGPLQQAISDGEISLRFLP